MTEIQVIEDIRLRVDDSEFPAAPILVHRQDIANAVKSMLMVAPSREFAAGVTALAAALGIQVKVEK